MIQMMKLTESIIIMQDAILAMYTAEKDPEKEQKVKEAAKKIEQSKNKIKPAKAEEKRKSCDIVDSESENKMIDDEEK